MLTCCMLVYHPRKRDMDDSEPTQVPNVGDRKLSLLSSVQREVRMIRTAIHSTLHTLRNSDQRELHYVHEIFNNRLTCIVDE